MFKSEQSDAGPSCREELPRRAFISGNEIRNEGDAVAGGAAGAGGTAGSLGNGGEGGAMTVIGMAGAAGTNGGAGIAGSFTED